MSQQPPSNDFDDPWAKESSWDETAPYADEPFEEQVAPQPAPVYDDEGEYFPPPRRGHGVLVFLVILSLLAFGLLYCVRWYQQQVDLPGPIGPEVSVVIRPGSSTAGIGKLLHTQNVIGNPTLFRYYAQSKGKGGFEAGRYTFPTNSTFDDTLRLLSAGPAVPDEQRLTIPEGFTVKQIGERIGARMPGRTAEKFFAATSSGVVKSPYGPPAGTSLEGLLFPETYTFSLEDDEAAIASRMVEAFDGVAEEVQLADAGAKVGLTPYEALIVASLIEREAKLDGDRAKISRVIYNRLKADMRLQIDATIIYGMGGGVTRVLNEDLERDGPYNSYTRAGLPPTPIANPGRESLIAALNPEPGDWLFYVVTDPSGAHSFAKTFNEHKRNIALAKKNGVR